MNNLANNGGLPQGQHRGNEGLAWLAGIMDGEGYVGACLPRNGIPKIDFAVNNCSVPMLETVQAIVFSVTHRKYKIQRCSDTKGRNFVFFTFRVGDQDGIWQILKAIMPWLTTKKSQAEAVVEYCESRKLNRHKREGFTAHELGIIDRVKDLRRAGYIPHPRVGETEREAPSA